MKHSILKLLTTVVLFICFAIPVQATPENYTLDPNHTYVLWHIDHFGFSNPSGKWMAKGTLVLDETKPQNSKLNVTIDVSTIVTGISELDKHLQTEDFFDVKQFPTATYNSNKIVITGKKSANVFGVLKMHGISKPIVLNVKLNKIGLNIITNKKTAGFSATLTLKRSDFNLTTLLPGLSDEVKLNIEAEATLDN